MPSFASATFRIDFLSVRRKLRPTWPPYKPLSENIATASIVTVRGRLMVLKQVLTARQSSYHRRRRRLKTVSGNVFVALIRTRLANCR